MAWEYINFEYPVPNLFEKHLLWVSTDCHIYFAMKLNNSDSWTYYAGDASHNLLSGKILTSYGSNESNAQTNYLQTSMDSNGKVLAVLPTIIQSRYIRMYVQTGSNVTFYEWRPSVRLTAHDIISGTLEITDELSEAPKITIKSSSVERLKIGNLYSTTYGIVGYDENSATIFELSDVNQKIAGFNFTASGINLDGIYFDSVNKKIAIQSTTFGSSGIQLDYNSGNPRYYIGNGDDRYISYYSDIGGDNLTWKASNTEMSADGILTVGRIIVTGGSVLGSVVTPGIHAANITVGSLLGSQISANTINASHIQVTYLSAINATIGVINPHIKMFNHVGASVNFVDGRNQSIFLGEGAGTDNTASTNVGMGYRAFYNNIDGRGNVGIGNGVLLNNASGDYNTIIGHVAGKNGSVCQSGCVFLGFAAGYNETTDNKLYISNSTTSSPLIYGDFTNKYIKINDNVFIEGTVQIRERASANASVPEYGQLWIKNDTPTSLWFTDDTGTDSQIGMTEGGNTVTASFESQDGYKIHVVNGIITQIEDLGYTDFWEND